MRRVLLAAVLTAGCASTDAPHVKLEPPNLVQDATCALQLAEIAGSVVLSNAVGTITAIANVLPACGPVVHRGAADVHALVGVVVAQVRERRQARREASGHEIAGDHTKSQEITCPACPACAQAPRYLGRDEKQEAIDRASGDEAVLREVLKAIAP